MSVINREPLFLPEHLILNTVNAILSIIREDYRDKVADNKEDENMLYLLLGNQTLGKLDIYKEAVKIFITTPEKPKHFDCKLSYDTNSSTAPQIYISQGSESSGNNSIGIGEGDAEELIFTSNDSADQYVAQYMRRYMASHHVMIVCENRMEMQIIYNVIKSMLVSCMAHFATKGLINLKLNGQELKMRGEIPDKLFQKAIIMNFEYQQVSPTILIQNVYRKIKLYWRANEATSVNGPIIFEQADDLTDSSSA